MNTMQVRRLPSADWIAFGVAVVALSLQYVNPVSLSLLTLIVFAPSVLREVGILKDGDEWSRGIMYRAGFHGLLAVGALIVLNRLLPFFGVFEPSMHMQEAFGGETIRKAVVWVFLFSYVLQYWGAREGGFRILLALGAMNLIFIFTGLGHIGEPAWVLSGAAIIIGLFVAFVGLAFLVRRRPKSGGVTLLVLGCVLLVVIIRVLFTVSHTGAQWGLVNAMVLIVPVFCVTGAALLRERSQ